MDKKVFLIGNAHLDPVWLWRKSEGLSEIKATFRSALDRMNEYPSYVFTAAATSYYQWIEASEPEMFEEIKRRVNEGRWVIGGGMWVQPDCNLPSGEAFARHMLYSQGFFLEKFGKIASFGYNVDSFGHNGMMPQLLKHGGMDSYVYMRPDDWENPSLPFGLSFWESPDGSRVLAYRIPLGYGDNGFSEEEYPDLAGLDQYTAKVRYFLKASGKAGIPLMSFYGVGDHGGGPTVRHLDALEKEIAARGGEVLYSGPEEYFDYVRKTVDPDQIPVVKTDLQHHASGCYAANSQLKKRNRVAENLLVSAEKFDWLGAKLTGAAQHTAQLKAAWEKVLFNQFHDILGGCSIRSAYDEAFDAFGSASDTAREIANFSLERISWRVNTVSLFSVPGKEDGARMFAGDGEGKPVVVFNPHSFPVRQSVNTSHVAAGVCDSEGRSVPIQKVRAERTNGTDLFETMFTAEVPALGWATYYIYYRTPMEAPATAGVSAAVCKLENSLVKIKFDRFTGAVTGYLDKTAGKDFAAGPMAVPLVIRDYENDTWSHRVFRFREQLGVFTDAEMKVIENGPIRATLRVTTRYNNSVLVQDFSLYEGRRELYVRCFLTFAEQLKILKLSFPAAVGGDTVTYSMPYGFIEKPADGCEENAHKWLDVSDENGLGLSLINDGRYSFDVLGRDIRMTAARGCGYADHFGCRDDLMEFQDQGEHFFHYILAPHETRDFARTVQMAAVLNSPLVLIPETHHAGPLATTGCAMEISADNVAASVIKAPEKGGGTVLRLYETAGRPVKARVKLRPAGLDCELDFGPQEIKTLLIDPRSGSYKEVNFIEM